MGLGVGMTRNLDKAGFGKPVPASWDDIEQFLHVNHARGSRSPAPPRHPHNGQRQSSDKYGSHLRHRWDWQPRQGSSGERQSSYAPSTGSCLVAHPVRADTHGSPIFTAVSFSTVHSTIVICLTFGRGSSVRARAR